MIAALVGGLRYAMRQAFVVRPRRRRWAALQQPFTHRTSDGLVFQLYPPEIIDADIFADDIYERRVLLLLRRHLAGGSMIDVGANIGNHAIFLHHRFRAIHAFEPNPIAADRLRANIAANNATNIIVHPVGLGASRADLPFMSNETGNLGGGSFVRSQFPVTAVLPVHVGDDYLAAIGVADITFIKIDVEEFEADVLAGLAGTIARDRPVILLEFDGRRGDSHFDRLRALLPGYVLAEAVPTSGGAGVIAKAMFTLRHGIEPPVREIDRADRRFYENLIAFPDRAAGEAFGLPGVTGNR